MSHQYQVLWRTDIAFCRFLHKTVYQVIRYFRHGTDTFPAFHDGVIQTGMPVQGNIPSLMWQHLYDNVIGIMDKAADGRNLVPVNIELAGIFDSGRFSAPAISQSDKGRDVVSRIIASYNRQM